MTISNFNIKCTIKFAFSTYGKACFSPSSSSMSESHTTIVLVFIELVSFDPISKETCNQLGITLKYKSYKVLVHTTIDFSCNGRLCFTIRVEMIFSKSY